MLGAERMDVDRIEVAGDRPVAAAEIAPRAAVRNRRASRRYFGCPLGAGSGGTAGAAASRRSFVLDSSQTSSSPTRALVIMRSPARADAARSRCPHAQREPLAARPDGAR